MIFNVPIEKDGEFHMKFFQLLADNIQVLGQDHSKWPDSIVFCGNIAKELLNIIKEKEWDFDKFNLEWKSASLNQIVISYQKPIPEVDEKPGVINDAIANREIEGFPSASTMKTISSQLAQGTSFKIERIIRPEIKIKLAR